MGLSLAFTKTHGPSIVAAFLTRERGLESTPSRHPKESEVTEQFEERQSSGDYVREDISFFSLATKILVSMNVDSLKDARSEPRFKHSPGKGRTVGPTLKASTSLLLIHSLFFSVFAVKKFLIKCYHTMTSFLLTSSSKELIKSDISTLNKVPSHLAIIIDESDLEKLVNDVADLAAWSVCSSIPVLTIYEARGLLKGVDSSLQVAVKRKVRRYFRGIKKIIINTPAWDTTTSNFLEEETGTVDLEINLLSKDDGRDAILDLTRSLCTLAQGVNSSLQSPLKPNINAVYESTTTIDRGVPSVYARHTQTHETGKALRQSRNIRRSEGMDYEQSKIAKANVLATTNITIPFLDAYMSTSTISEPNLLLVFRTDRVLAGFPPWSMRLCEICYVEHSSHVSYRGFLKGLQNYGKAEMRFGH